MEREDRILHDDKSKPKVTYMRTPGGLKPPELAERVVTFTGSGEEADLLVKGLRALEAGVKMFACIGAGSSGFGSVSLEKVQKLYGQISTEKFADSGPKTREEILDDLRAELKAKSSTD